MTVTVKITALPIYVAAPFRVKLKSQTFTTYGLIVRKDINFSVKEFDVLYMLFKPYLGTIARNMAKNALRKTSKMHFENYEDAFQVGTNEHIEYGPLKEEVIKCLKESIYELSVDERKCFISYYYYTKTIAVIAEETGLKESTVKSKLLRGRKKLKLKMEKKGFRYEDCKIFFE